MRLLAFLCPLLLAIAATAAPIERSLGRGLVYVRAQTLPADLPATKAPETNALVLDLRFVAASAEAAAAFSSWLEAHASARAPAIVLINSETSRPLRERVTGSGAPAGVVSIGPTADGISPDLELNVAPEDDRKAYEALTGDIAIETLIARTIEKDRRDEAYIMRSRNGGPAEVSQKGDATAKPETEPAPAPPFDAILQRAVQLHRALLALRRI